MIAVVQRVKEAKVEIEGEISGEISQGFLVLLGVKEGDTDEDFDYLCRKISGLRIFSDDEGRMNLGLKEVNGEILLVSQFTLIADTRKGNRPSFTDSAPVDEAVKYYEKMIKALKDEGHTVETGEFGADMQVSLVNDGPVTIILDSDDR